VLKRRDAAAGIPGLHAHMASRDQSSSS
jgi:hypothetical protein